MPDRVAVFIDGGYLSKVLKEEFDSPKIDFKRLSECLTENLSHLRTYYYDCLPYQSNPPTDEEKDRFAKVQRFHNALDSIERFQVRQGSLKKRNIDGRPIFQQKGVDVRLAIDLVQLSVSNVITHAVLVSADNDFVPAIKVAKDAGVVTRLYYSKILGRPNELWNCVDERYVIDKDLIDLILRQ